ncbi:MAG: hypothetical protein MK171_05300 [Pirellulales bacterium]|nr:hypothetical protein [Pirellulales bacterium]
MAKLAAAGSDSGNRSEDRSKWLEIALIFAIFFVFGGAPAPHVNETYYLTKAKHYWEADWCAGDPFLESADAHSVFYWCIGWLTGYFSLTTVAWIGRVVAWLLLAVAWQRLSSRVCPGRWRGVLTAMMFGAMLEHTTFAGEWVVGGVEGKCFAYAFVFFGLAALADRKWPAVWPWLGLASAFHVLVGAWSFVAASLVWITRSPAERPPLRQILPPVLLGAVLALPGLIPALLLTHGVDSDSIAQANTIYVFDRLPHHLAPLKLPHDELVGKAIRHEGLLLALVLLWLSCRRNMASHTAHGTHARNLERILCFAGWSAMFSASGLVWHALTWDRPVLAARVLKYYWFRLGDIAVPLAVCLAVGWLTHLLMAQRSRWAPLMMLLAVVLPGWQLLATSSQRYTDARPPADLGMRDTKSWQDACAWAQAATPPGSLFLVPRRAQSFNWNAHRPDLVTWKDVPQDATALLAWREQFFDVYYDTDETGRRLAFRSLATQGTERISKLAKKYDIDYVVTENFPTLQLPVAYINAHYTIYNTQESAL